MNIKAIITSIALAFSTSLMAGGLYIVAGGDFRLASLTAVFDVAQTDTELTLMTATWPSNNGRKYTYEIDNTFVGTNAYNLGIKHTFDTIGEHKIKVFANGTGVILWFPGSLNVKRIVQGGDMDTCVYSGGVNHSNLTSVVIKSGVKTIPNNCFLGNAGLTTMYLPDTISSIGTGAFNMDSKAWQSKLVSVRLPKNEGFTTLKERVFQHCRKLDNLVIPSSVVAYEVNALSNLAGMHNITLGVSTSCEANALGGLDSLQTVNYYGTLAQWKSDPLAQFLGNTEENPGSGVTQVTISGGSAVNSRQITLNFNYPED